MPEQKLDTDRRSEAISDRDLNELLRLIAAVKFGTVTVVIQDNKVIQLEKNEKIRLV